jgi:hypothetical protein
MVNNALGKTDKLAEAQKKARNLALQKEKDRKKEGGDLSAME